MTRIIKRSKGTFAVVKAYLKQAFPIIKQAAAWCAALTTIVGFLCVIPPILKACVAYTKTSQEVSEMHGEIKTLRSDMDRVNGSLETLIRMKGADPLNVVRLSLNPSGSRDEQ